MSKPVHSKNEILRSNTGLTINPSKAYSRSETRDKLTGLTIFQGGLFRQSQAIKNRFPSRATGTPRLDEHMLIVFCMLLVSSVQVKHQGFDQSLRISIHSIQVKLQGSGQGPRLSVSILFRSRFKVQVRVHGFQVKVHGFSIQSIQEKHQGSDLPAMCSAIQVKCQGPDFPAMGIAIDVRRQGCNLPAKVIAFSHPGQSTGSDLPSMVIAIDVRRQGSDLPAMVLVIQVNQQDSDLPSMVIAIRVKRQEPDPPSMVIVINVKRQGPDRPSMVIVIQDKHHGSDLPAMFKSPAIQDKHQGSDLPAMVIAIQVKCQGPDRPAMGIAIDVRRQGSDLPAMCSIIQVNQQDSDLPSMVIVIQVKHLGSDRQSMVKVLVSSHPGQASRFQYPSHGYRSVIEVKCQGSDLPAMCSVIQVKHQGPDRPPMSPAIQVKHQDSDHPCMVIVFSHPGQASWFRSPVNGYSSSLRSSRSSFKVLISRYMVIVLNPPRSCFTDPDSVRGYRPNGKDQNSNLGYSSNIKDLISNQGYGYTLFSLSLHAFFRIGLVCLRSGYTMKNLFSFQCDRYIHLARPLVIVGFISLLASQSKPAIMDPISVQCYSVCAVKGNKQEPGLHIGI
ncbi:hypothetical protein F4703DRAFT_1791235 [Phycomyces blakesleeanus]